MSSGEHGDLKQFGMYLVGASHAGNKIHAPLLSPVGCRKLCRYGIDGIHEYIGTGKCIKQRRRVVFEKKCIKGLHFSGRIDI